MAKDMECVSMIEINGLKKQYGHTTALKDVSLSLPQGEIVGLFGENGAGKTTLIKCILGLLRYKGDITLDGEAITRKNISRLSFATSEHSFFPNLTPAAHAQFYAEHFPRFSERRFKGLMEFFELPKGRSLYSWSAGQKNQFEVILSLSQGADYVLMDESFAGNDVFNREDFYKMLLGILEPHETVLLSTHLIEEVSGFISRAVLLRKGEIIGDVQTIDLDEQGRDLMDFVKEMYRYRTDRVSRAINDIAEEEE